MRCARERADDLNRGKVAERSRPLRSEVNSRPLSLSDGEANSIICLLKIQAKNVLFCVFASALGEIYVFPADFKTAFL